MWNKLLHRWQRFVGLLYNTWYSVEFHFKRDHEQVLHTFCIRCEGEFGDPNLTKEQYAQVMLNLSKPAEPIKGWGSYRIKVAGCEVSFSEELPGLQTTFETGNISRTRARKLVQEMAKNITQVTGLQSEVIDW